MHYLYAATLFSATVKSNIFQEGLQKGSGFKTVILQLLTKVVNDLELLLQKVSS